MFAFGKASTAQGATVVPALWRVCVHALAISKVDFGAGEGARADAEQLRDWLKGASRFNGIPVGQTVNGIKGTGRGRHQVGADGYSHAIDLVPYVKGIILWSMPEAVHWQYIYVMAEAVQAAAIAESVTLRWGAVWDRYINKLPLGAAALQREVAAYAKRHAGPDLLDGPHFEVVT